MGWPGCACFLLVNDQTLEGAAGGAPSLQPAPGRGGCLRGCRLSCGAWAAVTSGPLCPGRQLPASARAAWVPLSTASLHASPPPAATGSSCTERRPPKLRGGRTAGRGPGPSMCPRGCPRRQHPGPAHACGRHRSAGSGAGGARLWFSPPRACAPHFSLALPPLPMEEPESRQVGSGRRAAVWAPDGLRAGVCFGRPDAGGCRAELQLDPALPRGLQRRPVARPVLAKAHTLRPGGGGDRGLRPRRSPGS